VEPPDAEELSGTLWDALVVGTGMGGATLGYALARAGLRVLFCEKGRSHLARPSALRGDYAETFFSVEEAPSRRRAVELARSGRFADEIEDLSAERPTVFTPFIGSGTGGSTALYGMALERLFPVDFTPRRLHPKAEGSSLPEAWPIAYEDLLPYYDAAERLYRVRGGRDPLRNAPADAPLPAPPESTAPGQELLHFLARKGLHPYRLPTACDFVPGCQSCQGYLCPKDCKNDSAKICIEPALRAHGAVLLEECEVLKLRASKRRVEAADCYWGGKVITLRARLFVLGAGALLTPGLLLRSASSEWPNGLANDTGLVGRNLMRHLVDLYLLAPTGGARAVENRFKEVAFNDYYLWQGEKLGSVQSFGRLPPVSVLYQALAKDLVDAGYDWVRPLLWLAKPLVRRVLSRLVDARIALASTLEDLPYEDNRVTLSTAAGRALAIRYRMRLHERARAQLFRDLMRRTLSPRKYSMVKQAERNQQLAHACGTCRFGADPHQSVLDPSCRAHSLENLYVVDASFFPSSGGINPSLTIAANALRVAAHLAAKPHEWASRRGQYETRPQSR